MLKPCDKQNQSIAHQLCTHTTVVLLLIVSLAACSTTPVLKPVASMTVSDVLTEQDPVRFAKGFVAHIQPGANMALYLQFLHPNIREALIASSYAQPIYHSNAQNENRAIERMDLLGDAHVEVSTHEFNDVYHVKYELPEGSTPIPFKTIYPDSPRADRGYTLDKGEIVLVEFENGWRVVWHEML